MKIYDLRFALFRRRQPITVESLQVLLERLWHHGLRFSEEPTSQPLWEAQLQAKGRCYAEGEFHSLPLAEACHLIARSKQGVLTLHDHKLALALQIGDGPSGQQTDMFDTLQYERLELRIDPAFALPKAEVVATTSPLMQPYQQAGIVFAHWCRVIAQEAQAYIACGYDSESQDVVRTVLPWVASVLQSGQMLVPSWSLMWYHEPNALSPVTLQEVLNQPGALVQRTEQGGWWGLGPKWVIFSQEAAAMLEEMNIAATFEQGILAALTDHEKRRSYTEMALQHYERALELARAARYEEGEQMSVSAVTHMIELAANLQGSSADYLARLESMRAKFNQLHRQPDV